MSVVDKYLTYRGDVRAIAAAGGTLLLVTAHPEGWPTALYRLDAEKLTLAEDALPAGGVDVVTDGRSTWVAGTDRRIYRSAATGGEVAAIGPELETAPIAMALLADGRLGVLAGTQFVVLGQDGKTGQTISLPETGTCLAADPTGRWLAVGTEKGTVCVLDCEDKPEFLLGESAKLHDGPVTSLLFEPDELRFLSAGADGKLLSTHARGKLEPEDKGKGNNHADRVTAMLWSPAGDRLLTGGRDSALKTWPRTGGAKPATLKDGVAKVVDLAIVQVHGRSSVAAACDDNTIRFFPLDAAGKFADLSRRVHGAAAWAANELTQSEHDRRESALRTLAQWGDASSVELFAQHATQDSDHALRLLAAELVARSDHPRAAKLLEKLLAHPDEPVRLAALSGLRRTQGEANLAPLTLALAAEKPDLGRAAITALVKLAAKDDQALALLAKSLTSKSAETRLAALAGLEEVIDPQSPDASLAALTSSFADVRRAALLRLFQRAMLDRPAVQTALRRAAEDADPGVRAVAFRLSLYTRPRLVEALRTRDPDLNRELLELEGDAAEGAAVKKAGKATKRATDALDAPDYDPLLQATASRALDTCLRGARGLAVLGDERALGLLLQLSREQDAVARVEVARALGALADQRGAGRLRSFLFDPDAAVRDAAFTSLERLADADPLAAAEAALGAPHEDVRRRGLQAVIAACRRKLPQDAREPAWPLLVRALNDASPAVRGEAFKAALNLQICGGGVSTLRFALQSVHPDIRREVLTEAMAAVAEPWAWTLLLEFLSDPDPKLREETFDFATKRNKELEPLQAALKSRHADVRRRAVESLVKRHTKAAQAVLATALADDDKDVRQHALAALIGDDVLPALRDALSSPHDDVRARAARALARHGDKDVLPALVRLATVPEPPAGPPQAEWAKLVEEALDGMADLGDPAALPHLLPLLDNPHADLRKAAARALAFVAMGENPGALGRAMRHDDPQVKYHAALGLALGGDASAAPLVFSTEGAKVLPSKERLAAALALGPAGEDQLVTMLDHSDVRARTHAFLLLMLLELKAPPGVPSRCLACLSCVDAKTRLRAARGLDSYRDESLFLQFVKSLFDDRGDEKPWDIPADVIDTVAALIIHGSVQAKARTSNLLGRLFKEEQGAWDRAWAVHRTRFTAEIAAITKRSASARPAAPGQRYSPERLEELALGAYVGLVREQGASAGAKALAGQGPQIARIRQTALKWIAELARRRPTNAQPARAVFVQAMGDPNASVRLQAFDHLREMGMEPTQLAAEALGSGHTDLGVRGLELLSGAGATGGKVTDAGLAVLDRAMRSRTDDLAPEAARLLATQRPIVEVATAALEAVHPPLRLQAVAWLAAEYEKSPTAAAAPLRAALDSRYSAVREAAAVELARKRDPAAYEPLVRLLKDARDAAAQKRAISALVALGDPRTPAALVDRLSDDPSATADAASLLDAAGSFRRPEIADRLLTLATQNTKLRNVALGAVRSISGYDQPIEDPDDLRPDDRDWLTKQHPRHDAILAELLDRMIDLSPPTMTLRFVPAARWAPSKNVESVLARLATHPDDNLRRAAVEALGFRLRKRSGPADPLLSALSHRDPQTQFLAAEALARAGRPEGLSVLLAAVDSLPVLQLRERAVRALGELGDPRALDTLLRIATEDQHVLQHEATQALGHLGHSPEGPEIFKLLQRLATKTPGPLAANALRGLRWLGTPDAWRVVRDALADESHPWREVAAEVLAFDEGDLATRDLLLKVTATEPDLDVVRAAFASARRLLGPDSLEAHYAWVQNPNAEYYEDGESIDLLSRRGDTRRLFEILPKCPPEIQEALAGILLNRPDPPVTEAIAACASPDAATARVAARVLGRAGESAPPKARAALQSALDKWLQAWAERRAKPPSPDDYEEDDELTDRLTPTVRAFVWAAGRTGAADALLTAAAAAHPHDPLYRPIRREAVTALDNPKPSEALQSALESAATGDDPETRALAADILARRAPARAARLAAQLLPDPVTFDRVARDLPDNAAVTSALSGAAANAHYQGVALGHLIAGRDVDALARAATDPAAPEPARLGAVEALGKLATESAEQKLQSIGKAEKESAELRKAAWRALRRSKRARSPRQKLAGTEAKA